MPLRGRALILLLAASLGLAACRVDATVTVRVRADGSGRVTARAALDADAVRAAEIGGGKLEDRVRLGDLGAAGWSSSGWVRTTAGGAVLTVGKPFVRAEEAGAVVAELDGPDGPLRGVRVSRDASTFGAKWTFSGVGDLRELKTGIGTDPELLAKLTAERVDVAALDQRLLTRLRDGFRLRVIADLPHAAPRQWRVPMGSRVILREESSSFATEKLLLLLGGVVLAMLAIGLLVVGERRGRRRSRATSLRERVEPVAELDE